MTHVVSWLASVAAVLLTGCVVAPAGAQPHRRVHLSLREVSPANLACALDVATNAMVGEAILSCQRTDPDSHLGAHRPLTPSEAARLFTLAGQLTLEPRQPEVQPAPRPVGPKATLVVTRGADGVAVDVTQAPTGLSGSERELWHILRSLADELRGMKY